MAEIRERLLQAAHQRLMEGGYEAVQIAAVASCAGVATGTVYRYFPSKADLATALFARAVEPELAALEGAAAEPGTAQQRLATATSALVRRAIVAPVRAYALIAEPVLPEVESIRLRYRTAFAAVYARVLEEGIAAGEVEPCDTDIVAAAIIGSQAEALLVALGREQPVDVDALVHTLQRFVVSAVEPRSHSVDA